MGSPVACAPPSSLLDSLEGALLESDDEPLVRLPHVGANHEERVVLRLSGESSVQPAASADPLRCGGGPVAQVIDMRLQTVTKSQAFRTVTVSFQLCPRGAEDALWPAPFLPQCRLFTPIDFRFEC